MQFQHNGISISVGDAEIERLVLERLRSVPSVITTRGTSTPPPIGSEWPEHGGVYAGIARGVDGGSDYHLIVGPEHPDGEVNWDAMMKWAESTGLQPMRRKEQALCFANVPELFQPVAYWSGEQHASFSDYAWDQYFNTGLQDGWLKDLKFRARLVRRLTIQ